MVKSKCPKGMTWDKKLRKCMKQFITPETTMILIISTSLIISGLILAAK